jgi:hypothetical protein
MPDKLEPKPILNQAAIYQIRIKGHLDSQWTDWFEGLVITLEQEGDTLLSGPVADQAALHGLLKKVRDLGMSLVSVVQIQVMDSHQNDSQRRKHEHEQRTYSSNE